MSVVETHGQQQDGTYITPYSATIYYNPNCLFEVGCAMFVRGCQKIPMVQGAALDNAADSAEHPSARVILFDSGHKPEQFHRRGFQSITVLGPNTWKDTEGDIVRLCLTEFIDSLHLTLAQRWVLDHFALLLFPDYQPCSVEITQTAAKSLGLVLRCMAADNNLETQVAQLVNGDVFENVHDAICKGKGIRCAQDIMARNLVETGIHCKTTNSLWIPSTSLDRAVWAIGLTNADIVCTYRYTANGLVTLAYTHKLNHEVDWKAMFDIKGKFVSSETSGMIYTMYYELEYQNFAELLRERFTEQQKNEAQ